MTRNGGWSAKLRPSTVTCRSCIPSSSADWVLAGARLISSARRRLVKTGPARNTNSPERWSKTKEPVTSPGIRSGVNWMRLKPSRITRAKLRAIRVLARPGKSSISTWPSESSASRISSSTSRLPTTAFSTSSSSRPASTPTSATVGPSGIASLTGSPRSQTLHRPHQPLQPLQGEATLPPVRLRIRHQGRERLLAQQPTGGLRAALQVERVMPRQTLLDDRAQQRTQPVVEVEGGRAGEEHRALEPPQLGRPRLAGRPSPASQAPPGQGWVGLAGQPRQQPEGARPQDDGVGAQDQGQVQGQQQGQDQSAGGHGRRCPGGGGAAPDVVGQALDDRTPSSERTRRSSASAVARIRPSIAWWL